VNRLRTAAALALVLAALHPARAQAQRDTIRLAAPRDTVPAAARGDSIRMFDGDSAEAAGADTATGARRTPARWAAPFSVEGSGRATPSRPPREVVWIHPDSIQREEEPAAADSAGEGGDVGTLETGADSIQAPPRRTSTRRAASADSASEGRRSTRRTAASGDETEGRRSTRTASEDEGSSEGRRSTRTASTEGEESTAGRRTTSRATEEEGDSTPRRSSTRRTASDEGETETRRASGDGDAAEGRRATTARSATGTRGRTHTVAAGETLYGIARKYGATSAQLRALNPDVEWQNLDVGTVLRLPPARTGTTPARPASPPGERSATRAGEASGQRAPPRATTPPAASTRRRTHTVATGETLYGLARRYGVTVEAIKAANDMEGDAVRIGQTLVIPRAPTPR
jgi:membrane-bound lytic murein transglycosylase D